MQDADRFFEDVSAADLARELKAGKEGADG
jgi:hypothetical protein